MSNTSQPLQSPPETHEIPINQGNEDDQRNNGQFQLIFDLTGKKYGAWTVNSRSTTNPRRWHCTCKCGNQKEVLGASLRYEESTGCKECRVKGRLVDAKGSDRGLLTEAETAKELGFSWTEDVGKLRMRGILKPEPAFVANGRTAHHYDPSKIKDFKPCLETSKKLVSEGCVKPVNGVLWAIQRISEPDSKEEIALVDLGATKGAIYSFAKGAEKFDIPLWRLQQAVANGEDLARNDDDSEAFSVPVIYVYGNRNVGGHWQPVCFELDLKVFVRNTKPSKPIDREKWKTTRELAAMVGANTITEIHEVCQCAKWWKKQKKVLSQTIRVKRTGQTAEKMKLQEDGTRRKKAITRLHTEKRFDAEEFRRWWNEPLDKYVEKARTLMGAEGIATKDMREALAADGIVGTRFSRVMRLAGAAIKTIRVGKPKIYVRKHKGQTPKMRRSRPGEALKFVKDLLESGPVFSSQAHRLAEEKGFNVASICRAVDTLECKRDYIKGLGKDWNKWGNAIFWRLPKQEPLSKEEMRRVVEDYYETRSQALELPPAPPQPAAGGTPLVGQLVASATENEPDTESSSPFEKHLTYRMGERKALLAYLWDDGKMPVRNLEQTMKLLGYKRVCFASTKETFRKFKEAASNEIALKEMYEIVMSITLNTICLKKLGK
jgi:hypothetical protein